MYIQLVYFQSLGLQKDGPGQRPERTPHVVRGWERGDGEVAGAAGPVQEEISWVRSVVRARASGREEVGSVVVDTERLLGYIEISIQVVLT